MLVVRVVPVVLVQVGGMRLETTSKRARMPCITSCQAEAEDGITREPTVVVAVLLYTMLLLMRLMQVQVLMVVMMIMMRPRLPAGSHG
jgi:hypothetical protein